MKMTFWKALAFDVVCFDVYDFPWSDLLILHSYNFNLYIQERGF